VRRARASARTSVAFISGWASNTQVRDL